MLKLAPLLMVTFACLLAHSSTLSIEAYLKQVSLKNGQFKAAELNIKAYGLKASEASLDFLPSLIGDVSYLDNRQATTNSFSPTQTITWGGYLGVQSKLRTGTTLSLTYNTTQNNQSGSFVLPYSYYYNYPTISVSQPLWKDFGAAMSEANEAALTATYKSAQMNHQYLKQQITYNAETTYWRLALYREIVKFDKQALNRMERILKWNQRRVALSVADRVDLLQSQAALKQRQMQLQTDEENLRQIESDFNKLRGINSDIVSEQVSSIDTAVDAKNIEKLKKINIRLDVLSSMENNKALIEQAKAALERIKPDISLYGTVQFSGINNEFGQAQNASFNSTNPLYQVGLKVNVPLDFGLVSEIYEGNQAAITAGQYANEKIKTDAEQDWLDLEKRFKNILERFEMAKELEALQSQKLEAEKKRFNAGRTTSFQVLQFEDSYSEAQLGRLRIENEAIVIRALARLYQ